MIDYYCDANIHWNFIALINKKTFLLYRNININIFWKGKTYLWYIGKKPITLNRNINIYDIGEKYINDIGKKPGTRPQVGGKLAQKPNNSNKPSFNSKYEIEDI
jgi:hypothetical protein